MASEVRSPTAAVSDNSNGSSKSWADPTNCFASDDALAICGELGAAAPLGERLKATDYDFTIPSGATIDGIQVSVERQNANTGGAAACTDDECSLVVGGVVTGDDKATATGWSKGTDEIVTYGGPTDLWGLTLDDTDINAVGFGFVVAAVRTGGTPRPRCDHIQIEVFYTEAGGGGTTPVGRSLSLLWDVRSAVGRSLGLVYNVRSIVGLSVQALWNVRELAGRSVQALWNVNALVGRSVEALWNVRAAVGRSFSTPWNVRALAGRSLEATWNVLSTAITVGRSLAVSWHTRATAGRSVEAKWNVRSLASRSLEVVHNVRALVGRSIEASWSVRTVVGRAVNARWNVRALVGRSLQAVWDVLSDILPRNITMTPGAPTQKWRTYDAVRKWTTDEPERKWLAGTPTVNPEVGRMTDPIPSISKEYIYLPITAAISDGTTDPTGISNEIAFVPEGTQPSDEWVAGAWHSESSKHYAQALIGPGGDHVLTPDRYTPWVRFTDNPEIPAIDFATIVIT